ncbi:unnamed protein product [Caenorhabditis auriculariae]|uniref:Uncharacterized protein n=1 Tax=Caenorhabditis auriculariae TaxID=2777116 RepID=A0A8S1GVR7_9PELO|nr:unnamed protein product [Caenorhabditis auriculariae]
MHCSWIVVIFLLLLGYSSAELKAQTYELPSLLVDADQYFLQKRFPTNLTCHLAPGYSEARLTFVQWYKDDVLLENITEDYSWEDKTLTIFGVKQQNEGLYQCLADIINIRLSSRQLVDTRLFSSPVKIRRARMTKFDKISDHAITVRENEVARLPCAGMPDVVPGPATICFERLENDTCLGAKNSTKYLTTLTGMQISLVQPSDAGFYHCLVRNEYTNMTRRSPKPVLLYVREANSTDDEPSSDSEIKPTLTFPAKETTVDEPIPVDVVEGDDVLLECVIALAKIVWIKQNDSTPIISMNDNNSRFQQVWGNLKIQSVAQGDAGVYSCFGLPIVGSNSVVDENTHPRVDYRVTVHSPSGVHLGITQQADKSYMLECLATNLDYEIPMAFINGTPWTEAIPKMGTITTTNFFTNPIRVLLRVSDLFTGSIQCISRPAMEEAEVYGHGMESGRSNNFFVINNPFATDNLIMQGPNNLTVRAGGTADFPCLVQRVRSKSWKKNGKYISLFSNKTQLVGSNSLRVKNVDMNDIGWYTCVVIGQTLQQSESSAFLNVIPADAPESEIPETSTEPFLAKKKEEKIDVEDVRGFVTGTQVRIQWSVFGKMEALTTISNFKIEVQRSGAPNDSWIEAESVDSHVRATTIKNLIPDNKYKFRILLNRDKGAPVISTPTSWMTVEQPSRDVLPTPPLLEVFRQISWDKAIVKWSHESPISNGAAKTFMIVHSEKDSNKSSVTQVDGNQTDAVISKLHIGRVYTVSMVAENAAGKSLSSNELELKVTEPEVTMLVRGYFETFLTHVTFRNLALFGIILFVSLLVILICCSVFCNLRSGKKKAPPSKNQPNGKFFDASFRIFNEQKVHKSRAFQENDLFDGDFDESSPLKKSEKRLSAHSLKYDFTESGVLPNLYGGIGEDQEDRISHDLPNDSNFVRQSSAVPREYATHTTARCYSPSSRTSHEMLVSYSQSMGRSSIQDSNSQICGTLSKVTAYKYPDSLLYSPGTSSSIADTSSSGIVVNRMNCDSPTNAPTDESDQGIRCGSSRNSHISSTDSKAIPMHTFKPNIVTSSFMSTFDRRKPTPVLQ